MYSKAHETMLEVFQGVADSINGLINYDGDSDNGHRLDCNNKVTT